MDSLQVPLPTLQYAGEGRHTPGVGLDRHGYIEIIADPEYDDHPQVCIKSISCAL